jgi:NAD(P)H dehydrogenase (quinone)
MNVSVILAHPTPGSFNHAIAQTAAEQLWLNRHTVMVHDLYQEGFEPLLAAGEAATDPAAPLPRLVAAHCAEIARADGIVIVHPNWWGAPPAIMKGWVDRVLRAGVAYRFDEGDGGEGVPVGLLRARTALVFNTANTPAAREAATFGDPLDLTWKKCIFGLCGVNDVRRETFSVVVTSTQEEREGWLATVRRMVDDAFGAP